MKAAKTLGGTGLPVLLTG